MIVLNSGSYSVIIEPEKGGLVSGLRWRNKELLYSPHSRPQASNGIRLYGCWPLVPFANRAFEGKLRFKGTEVQLPLNDDHSTMHGFGWQNAWEIEAQTSSSVTMVHKSEDAFMPFEYHARQTIQLNEKGALFSLEVTNTGDTPLPYGIGFHPWFNCNETTLFCAKAGGKMSFGEKYRPIGKALLSGEADFSIPKPIKTGKEVAVNYLNWDGKARLDYAGYSINIEASDTLRTPVLWTPEKADFVCFEPQSHASGAPSELAAQEHAPLTMLKSNEKLKGWMRIGVVND